MKDQQTLRFLGSVACCAILGCQPGQGVSSTADSFERDVTRSPDSGEADTPVPAGDSDSAEVADAAVQDEQPSAPVAESAVSDQKRSDEPSQPTATGQTGKGTPAADVLPPAEPDLPSESAPATTGGAEAPTEVRETFFPNGATRRQWLVKVLPDGTEVEHGEALLWFDNGQVKLQGEYIDGVREGLWLAWYSNGNDRGKGRLYRGRRMGTWTMWDEKGQKRSEVAYEMGLRHGRSTVWDADGKVTETGEYVRKKKHGTWVTYVDGEKTETEWVKGVQVE